MTVPVLPDTERRTRYVVVSATTGPFSVPFDLYADSTDYAQWVEVWLDGIKLTAVTDWTLDSPSGSIGVIARPITDARITFTSARSGTVDIVGARRPRRTTQLTEGTAETAASRNRTYTDLMAIAREMWDRIGRTIVGVPGDAFDAIPPSATRANKFLAFDNEGQPTASIATTPADLADALTRTVRTPDGEALTQLPESAARAGLFLSFDGSGDVNLISGVTPGDVAVSSFMEPALAASNTEEFFSAVGGAFVILSGGRLSLTTGVPVTESDVTAATTVYLAMVDNDRTAIYTGTLWATRQYTGELSLALDSNSGHTGYHQSGKNFDLFEFWDGSAVDIGTGPAWSSNTSRGTGAGTTELEIFEGRLVNKASITLRIGTTSGDTTTIAARKANYRGSFRCTADGQTEDSFAKRLVFDALRPVLRPMRKVEATNSWAYSLAAFHQANASTANQIAYLHGLAGRMVECEVIGYATNSDSSPTPVMVGVGIDSSTVDSSTRRKSSLITNSHDIPCYSWYEGYPGIGYHEIRWLEYAGGTADTQTWYGDNGDIFMQTGIRGWTLV